MRSLTKNEKDFMESLYKKLDSLRDRMKSYPLRSTYPTVASWTIFTLLHDIITALTEGVMNTAKNAKLQKYQEPLTNLADTMWQNWKGAPSLAPYQSAMIRANAASTTKKPDLIVKFPDDNYIPTLQAHLKSIRTEVAALAVLWSMSDDLDSQSMLYDMALGLNKAFKTAAKNLGDMGESLAKGTARAAGSIVSAFFSALWKPALIITGIVLVYKKLDRAEIGPLKGPESLPPRRR